MIVLCSLSLGRPHLECLVPSWILQYRGIWTYWRVEQRAMEMLKVLEHVNYVERLREMGLITLERRKCKGHLSMCITYLTGR